MTFIVLGLGEFNEVNAEQPKNIAFISSTLIHITNERRRGVMKKRRLIPIINIVLAAILMISIVSVPSFETEAASNNKVRKILDKAYLQMKRYNTVSYRYTDTYTYSDIKNKDYGYSISDLKTSYSVKMSSTSTEELWHIKSKIYSKYDWDTKWSVEKATNNNKTPDKYFGKKLFQYLVKNIKNPKIKKNTKYTYVIVGKTNISNNEYKKIEFTINKKENCVIGMVLYYNDIDTEDVWGDKITISDRKWTITNMCYGKGNLKYPKLLK